MLSKLRHCVVLICLLTALAVCLFLLHINEMTPTILQFTRGNSMHQLEALHNMLFHILKIWEFSRVSILQISDFGTSHEV